MCLQFNKKTYCVCVCAVIHLIHSSMNFHSVQVKISLATKNKLTILHAWLNQYFRDYTHAVMLV